MGRKQNQASRKICKSENKNQMNSLIKVLRPKVYITEASNFKNLVQQLTRNISNPIPFNPPNFVQEPPVMEIPIMQNENHCYTENSLEWSSSLECSSQDSLPSSDFTNSTSSPQSLPSSFASLASSPQEGDYAVPETIFNVLESSFANNSICNAFGDIESWLLEIDSFSCNWNAFDNQIPAAQLPELFADCSDFPNLW